MDSTANIENNSLNFRAYVVDNMQAFDTILTNLEKASTKSKAYFVKTLIKDNKVDNNLLETYQFESHGFAWFETYRIGLKKPLIGSKD